MADFYDIDETFSLNAQGDINILTDQSAIVQSIKNIIFMTTGFRPGIGVSNEKYGANVEQYLFAPMTQFSAQSMSDSLYRHLTIFEPRIGIDGVHVSANIPEARFEIEINYTIDGSTDKLTFRTVINQL